MDTEKIFPDSKVEEIKKFLETVSGYSKIYIGCDSHKFKRKNGTELWACFTVVLVIHKDNSRGCKIFGHSIYERIYDSKPDKPSYRLMNEVYKAAGLYLQLYPILCDRDVEIHLDINPKKEHASSMIVQQAIGYIRGTCNIVPKIKPESWAASAAADRFIGVK